MKRLASEVLRDLEIRVARLEKQSNIEWKVEGFPLNGDRLEIYKFRGNERQFLKWFKGENLENLLDDIQIYGDGGDWEVYNGKLSRTARLEKQSSKDIFRLPNVETVDFSPAGSGKQYQFERTHDVVAFDMNHRDIRLLIKTLGRLYDHPITGKVQGGGTVDGPLQRALIKKKDILLLNFNLIPKGDLDFTKEVIRNNPTSVFYLEIAEDRKHSRRSFD